MLKLISATPSPYARKVRIALAEKAIAFELVTEVPCDDVADPVDVDTVEDLRRLEELSAPLRGRTIGRRRD